MDFIQIITYLIIGGAVALTYAYLNSAARQEITADDDGNFSLRMNKLYLVMGWIGTGTALVFTIVIFIFQTQLMLFIGLMMLAIFGGSGLPCLFYYYNHKVVFNKEEVMVTNWKKQTSSFKWKAVEKVKFKHMFGLLEFTHNEGVTKIHQHLLGFTDLALMMESQTPWNSRDLRLPV